MELSGQVTPFDLVVLLLLLHVVAIVVAMVLSGEGRPKSTSLWRYADPRVFSTLFTLVVLAYWAVVTVGDQNPLAGLLMLEVGNDVFLPILLGLLLLSFGASNALLLTRILFGELRPGPPTRGDVVAVSGTARSVEGTVETPYAGVEALCSHATVEAHEHSVRLSSWAEHDERVECRRFAVDCPGQRVHVQPDAAHWCLPATYRATVDAGDPVPERVAMAVGNDPGLDVPDSPKAGFSIDEQRFIERTLEPDRQVLVVGQLTDVDGTPVVDGGSPFVVTQGELGLVYASMTAWTVVGGPLGVWLLVRGFRRLATFVGLL